MDIEKIRKWMEITNEYRSSDFWTKVLQEKRPEDFFSEQKKQQNIDIHQNDEYYYITMEIPGINKEDLAIHLLSGTRLQVKGVIRHVFPVEMEVRSERMYGEFEQIIDLPGYANAETIHIQVHNGLLFITYPRQIEKIQFDY
ncbi:Hsp20/alpha crystallin family protein [Bacillus salacetis]|uniref:Hsp20/alpha crystallin family protein n=1 Tax=Bacillus salacetis TaxID=2315464 RepID=A0A3A1R520_9BACI|nr:Hsp20/alpha crystallin family protein [Bacillus salacetis]RIW35085.1 Hsp20/alpha crystallin family protein [Bacillus salacetis]